MDSTHLQLPYLAAAKAQKHVAHNGALRRLDAMVQLAVLDRTRTAPPGSPDDGDRHIVASGATGLWSGWDLNIWLDAMPANGRDFSLQPHVGLVRRRTGCRRPAPHSPPGYVELDSRDGFDAGPRRDLACDQHAPLGSLKLRAEAEAPERDLRSRYSLR